MPDAVSAGINKLCYSHGISFVLQIGYIRWLVGTGFFCIIRWIKIIVNVTIPVTHHRSIGFQPWPVPPGSIIDAVPGKVYLQRGVVCIFSKILHAGSGIQIRSLMNHHSIYRSVGEKALFHYFLHTFVHNFRFFH